MKTYTVQYDSEDAPKSIILDRTESLAEAIRLSEAARNNAYVLHVALDLQRRVVAGRALWLDSHGREHPAPEDSGGSR